MDLTSYATHSPYTDPAGYAALLAQVPSDTQSLHTAVMCTITHYRAGPAPSPRQLADIDSRWISRLCATAVDRSPGPLTAERASQHKVGGCCRDHTLLAVAILRQHGIPARSRVGFAGYLTPGFHHDHVVAERWSQQQGRWVRFDPEFDADDLGLSIHDLPRGADTPFQDTPFQTAAQAWLAYRAGHTDLSTYGVMPNHPVLRSPGFVQRYLLLDLAHLMRTELLLWDVWGPGTDPAEPTGQRPADLPSTRARPDLFEVTDALAHLIEQADDGDSGAAAELTTIWATRAQLRPGRYVRTVSPSGRSGITDLQTRSTEWTHTAVPMDIAAAT